MHAFLAHPDQDQAHLDASRLREAVQEANVPVLLLLLVQMTGDLSWMEAPYLPSRNEGLGDNRTGGFGEERQAEIREAALQAIERWRAGEPLALPSPSPELLAEMLSVSMGEPVPSEYGPMIAEELGIDVREESAGEIPALPPSGFEVLIIGAGISGIAAAVNLERAGIPYRIVERNSGLGGTWLVNRYPGCGVDTPSPIYSYSFAPREWSRYFAGRDEVLGYLQDVAAERGVDRHVSFGHTVRSARYLEPEQRWRVCVVRPDGTEEILEPNAVISAVGAFTSPKFPEIFGLARFKGPLVHTARWPEQGIELDGRRVGVIGTGASAMQVVPALAGRASQLHVFQRSPQWIAPFPYLHAEIPETLRRLGCEVPLYRAWYRIRWTWTFNDRLYPALQKDPQWAHPERSVSAENDLHRVYFTRYLERQVAERPELRESMLPDYPPFGKRILLDNGWFGALTRDDVSLVSDGIAEVTADGVVTDAGEEIELDVVICATGFDVVRFLDSIEVNGRSGQTLREAWDDDDARAYLGTTVPDFPNFFILYGPNIQPGHGGSLVGLAELQAGYVADLLRQMFASGAGSLECRRGVWTRYNERVDEAHEQMVWTHPGMSTYYRNTRGRVVVPGPFRNVDLWHRLKRARLDEYVLESARAVS